MQTGRQVYGGGILAELNSLATVVNTVSATDLFTFSLPAARLQAGDVLKLRASGDRLNNSGSNVNYTFKARIGTSYPLNTGAVAFGFGANRALWTFDATITIVSATSQLWDGDLNFTGQTTNTLAAVATSFCFVGGGGSATSAEDTSSVKTVGLEVTMGTAVATADMRCQAASLILLREAP